MKVDAHQHFWQYNTEEYPWLGLDKAALKKDHLPHHITPFLADVGIEGTIAVQARQTVAETEWLLALADKHSFIKGIVGWFDLGSSTFPDELERFQAYSKLCGVRYPIPHEPNDKLRLNKEFVHSLALLTKLNLVYDILIFPRHLPLACSLVEKFPNQRFVLDHIAKPFIAEKLVEPWGSDIRRLAAYPNVFCKVSGMVNQANLQRWQPADFRPYLDVVFEAFGPRRIMVGSDWPVCTLAGNYAEVFDLVDNYVRQFSEEEQAEVFGNTAKRCYRIFEA